MMIINIYAKHKRQNLEAYHHRVYICVSRQSRARKWWRSGIIYCMPIPFNIVFHNANKGKMRINVLDLSRFCALGREWFPTPFTFLPNSYVCFRWSRNHFEGYVYIYIYMPRNSEEGFWMTEFPTIRSLHFCTSHWVHFHFWSSFSFLFIIITRESYIFSCFQKCMFIKNYYYFLFFITIIISIFF